MSVGLINIQNVIIVVWCCHPAVIVGRDQNV